MKFTTTHRETRPFDRSRMALAGWQAYADSVRAAPGPISLTTLQRLRRMRASVIAGDPVDPALMHQVESERDGREWVGALRVQGAITAPSRRQVAIWHAWRATLRL